MSLSGKRWVWREQDQNRVDSLVESLGLTPALARLLINRGIEDAEQARVFLCPSLDQLHSPWEMAGMAKAVDRLLAALAKNEKIVVHGDYDADGISAAVMLVEALRRLGGRVDYYLPSRFAEGYGLNLEPLKQIKEDGASLVITVDCGINAAAELSWAAENGLDMIVTDHHQPLAALPGAATVINPLQENCPYPFKELAGAGVAFKVAAALMEKAKEPFPEDLLDLAALGTAADVVPLLGENRILVYQGLQVLRRQRRIGFKALAEAVSLNKERISSTTLSFILAPAINAAGRMGEALPAAELLLEEDPSRAKSLSEKLHRVNQLRRATEQKILLEAEEAAIEQLSGGDQQIVTLAEANWHHGVIGIVASRLVDKYNRPFCLIALEGEEGRGSARSVAGFDITAALAECSSVLERFGGHEQAAGFTVRADRVEELRDSLNRYGRLNLEESSLTPQLFIEAELDDSEIRLALTERLEELQPFGAANPVPLFGSSGWQIQSWRLVGADHKHLKLQLKKGEKNLDPIIFSGSSLEPRLEKGRCVDLALKLKNGYYREQKTLESEVKDLRYSDSSRSGRCEVIDRRHCEKQPDLLRDLLDRNGSKALIFTATAARSEEIKKSCFLQDPPYFISSGSLNGSGSLPGGLKPIILYDLPLFEELLKHILQHRVAEKEAAVYLFYGQDDLKRNRRLLDLSLPAAKDLEKIAAAIAGNPGAASGPAFCELVAKSIGFKPAASFLKRAETILSETGYIEEGFLAMSWPEIKDRWPSLLESSSTYRSTADLRRECEQFQKHLLEAPAPELASFFDTLAGD